MTVLISMNGTTYESPDYIVSQIEDGSLTREDLEGATWAVETPRATLGLTYNLPEGEVEYHEVDLVELDEYYDWSSVEDYEVTVKYCFLRINGREWELISDGLEVCMHNKRPDRIEFSSWTDREHIEYAVISRGDLGCWEEIDCALEDIEFSAALEAEEEGE